ncbi:crossover junction endonuclease EME1 [Colletes gigas]|uniref:crossover junction endonuclease EME1 n=1 Tax=Colletes gigas TaxID=935657 RepID=UPI001C9B9D08|nr:crossover junction endonuclease EME1 [Colletes gigas]
MTDVILLSDSEESVLPIKNYELQNVNKENRKKLLLADNDSDDAEFPEVHFHHDIDVNEEFDLQNDIDKSSTSNGNSKLNNAKKSSTSDLSDTEENLNDVKRKRVKQKAVKTVTKKSKSQLTEGKLKRQEQLIRERALKAIASKKLKNIKPGECMKFVEVVLDEAIENFDFIKNITSTLLEANIQYSINAELIPNSITWKRIVENSYVDDTNKICTETDVQRINQILIIWNWDKALMEVADGSFCATISTIKASIPNYNMILVIFGIEDYFTSRKQTRNSVKNRTKNKAQKTNTKNNCEFQSFPEISRQQLETCLNEIQILSKCNSRLLNSFKDLALMVYQCTKAIAEIPYKLETNKNITSKFDWYVMGDNRNTVRVDKDGNGLKRLWQQQLCQFNLSSLEIAEAISAVYPCPVDLMETYNNCTHQEGMNLLKDIVVRRAAGPLTTLRKLGPELSKKVYIMFTSEDGEKVLS